MSQNAEALAKRPIRNCNDARAEREVPEVCEYPDSGKYLAMAALPDAKYFDPIRRPANGVDDRDGEP